MPRAIEDYICASEDRPHYNNETLDLYGFYYPMRRPHVTTINIINKTEIIEQGVSEGWLVWRCNEGHASSFYGR